MINSNTAIFLDRDGVINKEKDDYVKSVDELEIFPYVGNSIKKIHKLGFLAIVITNQSAINRGLTTHENVIMIHDQIQEILKPFQILMKTMVGEQDHLNVVLTKKLNQLDLVVFLNQKI